MSQTLYGVAAIAAQRWGSREFLTVGSGRETLTFADLAEQADSFGRLLAERGVRSGDRVALAMTNSVDWSIAAYGIARAGAVNVALSTRLTARETSHMIRLTEPSLVILDDEVRGHNLVDEWLGTIRAAGANDVLVRSRRGKSYPDTSDWNDAIAKRRAPLPDADELVAAGGPMAGVAAVLSTSGTTSAPKGVMLTHNGLITLARAVGERQALTTEDRFLSVAPFFHCSGFMHGLLTCLIAGTRLFATSRYDRNEFWKTLVGEDITVYNGPITPLQELAADAGINPRQARAFNRAWYSAPAAEMARLEEVWGVRMCEIYGLTETGGNVALCGPDDPVDMRHDSDGRPHEGVQVTIVDPVTRNVCPDGQAGEILVRGWNVMRGYIRDPRSTAEVIDPQGWLHTGDQGVRLPGGYIKFLSRLKDIIRVGGENVSPMEIEEILATHAAVSEAAVVSAPHPRLGEVPAAFVVLKAGRSADEAELRRFCHEHLAEFKVPRRFLFVDALPRTGTANRIQKANLRERLSPFQSPAAVEDAPGNPIIGGPNV